MTPLCAQTASCNVQRETAAKLSAELEERRREEQRLAAEVEAHEEAKLGLDEQYNSLQASL